LKYLNEEDIKGSADGKPKLILAAVVVFTPSPVNVRSGHYTSYSPPHVSTDYIQRSAKRMPNNSWSAEFYCIDHRNTEDDTIDASNDEASKVIYVLLSSANSPLGAGTSNYGSSPWTEKVYNFFDDNTNNLGWYGLGTSLGNAGSSFHYYGGGQFMTGGGRAPAGGCWGPSNTVNPMAASYSPWKLPLSAASKSLGVLSVIYSVDSGYSEGGVYGGATGFVAGVASWGAAQYVGAIIGGAVGGGLPGAIAGVMVGFVVANAVNYAVTWAADVIGAGLGGFFGGGGRRDGGSGGPGGVDLGRLPTWKNLHIEPSILLKTRLNLVTPLLSPWDDVVNLVNDRMLPPS